MQVVRLPAFLGSRRNAPMDNSAVEGWLDLVSQRITGPLGMNDTFLIAIPNQQPRLAAGYAQALAKGDGGGRR
ncbi:MAG: beta-lactamase family protein [Deltaproteobacteria bacterium]|nr:MAG: beta-lactamase family protein [Deltaproteobacteria bacterium]